MALKIRKATRSQIKLRMALIGPAGSGKTYTALKLARIIAGDGKILVLDTEHASSEKYAEYIDGEVGQLSFDVIVPESFKPEVYIEAIKMAEQNGYTVLVIDSLSHAWMGKDGALELVDRAAARMSVPNSYAAWRDVTPLHNRMVDAILSSNIHIIATMRSKMEYVQEKDASGKTVIRKVGMQPVQRDGLEYEFDIVADMDQNNNLIIGKTRCPALTGQIFPKPGRNVADLIVSWLSAGAPLAQTNQQDVHRKLAELAELGTSANQAVKAGTYAGEALDKLNAALDHARQIYAKRDEATEEQVDACIKALREAMAQEVAA